MFKEKKIIISINIASNSCKIKTENCPMNLAPLEVTGVLPQQQQFGQQARDKRQMKGRRKN